LGYCRKGTDNNLSNNLSNEVNETRCLVLPATILSCFLFGGTATSAGGELKYDFGPQGVRVADACMRLGIQQQYTREMEYGFVYHGAGESTGSRQRSGQFDARRNSLVCQSPTLTFVQDLPHGEYFVSLASGDARYPGSASARLSGAEVVPLTQTGTGEFVTVDSHRVEVTDGKPIVIDRYTAMTFITFRDNWDERTNFYGSNWQGKHNNGVPLFMAHLMLDLPIIRVSTVYNWREGPIITRDKDGTISRSQVTYQTKGFPFRATL
jgi:hypothetical protein